MPDSYSIVMFAHNEQNNIATSVQSIFENSDQYLEQLVVIANGCSDRTVEIIVELKKIYQKLKLVELVVGDKCNAWNEYVHHLSMDSEVHFFVDADVRFTKNAFPQMFKMLCSASSATAIAGLPFSGRNIEKYKDMVTNGWCLFGNCYGVKLEFIQLAKDKGFKLPIGLGWIDSAITKVIYKDIDNTKKPLRGKVIFDENSGYEFDSLSIFKLSDIQLYFNRIVRYRLGKLQEKYLEKIPFDEWPEDLVEINRRVLNDIIENESYFNVLDRFLVVKRINRFLEKMADK